MFPKIGVPPNHPILIGFSIANHPFWKDPFLDFVTTKTTVDGGCFPGS